MFQVDLASGVPIYEQLINNVVRLASYGVIKSGDKLPPVRVLAAQLGVNPNTVAKAYRELEQMGYVYTVVGSGSYVKENAEQHVFRKKIALDEFRKACVQAFALGIAKQELFDSVEEVFKGGDSVD